MRDWIVLILAWISGMLIGVSQGIRIADQDWEYNCQQLGAHRADKTVYVCSVKED